MQQPSETASSVSGARTSVILAALHAVLDSIDYGVIFLDANLQVRGHNQAYREMWQIDESFLNRKPSLQELLEFYYKRGDVYSVAEEHWPQYVEDRVGSIAAGSIDWVELRTADDRIIQYQCTMLPDGGRLLSYFDVTERRQVEQTLQESERRYTLLADAAEDGIYDWDIAGDDVYISPRLDAYLRFEPGELVRDLRHWQERIHADDRDKYEQALREHLRSDSNRWECEYRLRDKRGHYRWVLDHGATVRAADGRAVRMVGAIRDITAEKHAEEALRRSEERFKAYAGIAADWFWEMGADLRYIYISERHEVITGAERSAVLGRTPMERLPGRVGEGVDLDGYFKALQAHEPFEFEYEWLHPNGTSRFLRNTGAPVFDADGTFQGYRGVGRDLTETRQADQLLQSVIDAVPAMINAKDRQSRYLLMNRYQAELYGVSTADAVGMTAAELLGKEYGERTHKLDQQVFECGEPLPNYEEPFTDAHGHQHTFLTTKVPLRSLDGEPNWVATVSLDISDRVRADRELARKAALQQLSHTITSAANEALRLSDALEFVLIEICAATGWPVGHVYWRDQASDEMRPSGLWRATGERFEVFREATESSSFASGVGLPGRVLATGKPAWIADVTRDENFPRGRVGDIGVKGAFAFPVLVGREVVAVVEFFTEQPAEPDEILLEVVAQIGIQLGRVAERERAANRLRDSEERFRTVAESATDPIISIDSDGAVVGWNKAAAETFGYEPTEIIGKSVQTIIPAEFREQHQSALQRVNEGGKPRLLNRTIEVRGLHRDGSLIPVELSLSNWSVGGERYYTGIVRDITERKRVETSLRDSEERYALATQAATEGIYEWDIATGALFLSDRAKQLFSLPHRGLTAAAWNERVHPDDFETYREALIEYFKGHAEHMECEYRLRDGTGAYVWILDRGMVVRDEEGRAIRMVGALTDITSRKQIVLDLREARDTAEAATLAKSRFLANMSHELRTPLNAVIGIAEMLLEDTDERRMPEFTEPLERICRAGRHLLYLINELLDLSRMEEGKIELYVEEFDIAALVDEAVAIAEPLAEQSGSSLSVDYPEQLGNMIADRTRVHQVVLNLLSNACKLTESGTVTLTAARRSITGRDWLEVRVGSSASGVDVEQVETLFDEFTNEDSSVARALGGTGLGLAISRRFCRLMSGDISVETGDSGMLTFVMRLPTAPQSADSG